MAKVIYIFYWKGVDGERVKDRPFACSNKRILAEKVKGTSGLSYENLVRIFTKQRRFYWEDNEHFIVKIYASEIKRGKQKVLGRGRDVHLFKRKDEY